MAVNKKGVELKEYPKLVKVGDKKVRVMNKEEEDKLAAPKEDKKQKPVDNTASVAGNAPAAGWGTANPQGTK